MISEICFSTFLFLVPGNYTEWSEWSVCNRTCGGGQQKRGRNCTNPSPANGVLNCTEQGLGAAEEISPCNEHPCPGKERLIMYFLLDSFKGVIIMTQHVRFIWVFAFEQRITMFSA